MDSTTIPKMNFKNNNLLIHNNKPKYFNSKVTLHFITKIYPVIHHLSSSVKYIIFHLPFRMIRGIPNVSDDFPENIEYDVLLLLPTRMLVELSHAIEGWRGVISNPYFCRRNLILAGNRN